MMLCVVCGVVAMAGLVCSRALMISVCGIVLKERQMVWMRQGVKANKL